MLGNFYFKYYRYIQPTDVVLPMVVACNLDNQVDKQYASLPMLQIPLENY